MNILPPALSDVIDALSVLPGVGTRTAERYALYLLKAPAQKAQSLTESIAALKDNIKVCPRTYALIDVNLDESPLYSSPTRDKKLVAVVAEPFDIVAMEKTNMFKGTYHVLGGLISPIDGVGPENIHGRELVTRIKEDKVEEIIIATNAGVEGETTSMYLQSLLKDTGVKITRLARGLPIGVDLEYADQITLTRAIEGRQEV